MVPDDVRQPLVAGYYTLSATSVALENMPEEFARKLPRYPFAPATLLGRLARYVQFPGTGKLLLVDGLKRAYRQTGEIAAATVVVDAKDARARAFYESFGFRALRASADRLLLPMQTIATLPIAASTPPLPGEVDEVAWKWPASSR